MEIIEKGDADLNAADQNGRTPLHMTCYRVSVPIDQDDSIARVASEAHGESNNPLTIRGNRDGKTCF